MITSFGPSTRRGGIPALAVLLVLSVTALTGAEESVIAQRSAEMAVANSAAPETTVLLARDMPSTRPLALPAETTEPDTAPPQAAPPAATPVSVTEPKTDATQPPAKADKAGTKATAASLRQASTRRPEARTAGISPALSSAVTPPNDREDQGRQDACGTEATAPTPVPQTATKNPATLHNAINKAARDYADSLEVKSTRPGEDLPFTITVGGSIQVRGEYRSGMPKNSALSRSDGFNASMRTRVAVCADFGQAQCVVEASKTQGRNGFLGPRDVD